MSCVQFAHAMPAVYSLKGVCSSLLLHEGNYNAGIHLHCVEADTGLGVMAFLPLLEEDCQGHAVREMRQLGKALSPGVCSALQGLHNQRFFNSQSHTLKLPDKIITAVSDLQGKCYFLG